MVKHKWPRYRTKTLKAVQGSAIKPKMVIGAASHVSQNATDCCLTLLDLLLLKLKFPESRIFHFSKKLRRC